MSLNKLSSLFKRSPRSLHESVFSLNYRRLLANIATFVLFGAGAAAFAAEESTRAISQDQFDKALIEIPGNDYDVLLPEDSHSNASRDIALIFSESHYLRPRVHRNDDLSVKVLNKYIDILDGNRSYFLAQDIEDFQRFRYLIDDNITSGHLKPAYELYQVFQTRWLERYDYALKLIEKPMDFSVQESFDFDREKSPWAKTRAELDEIWHQRIKADALSLVLAEKSWQETQEVLSKRYTMAKRRITQNKSEDIFEYFMNAFALTIEPHATYFSPREAENFDIEMKLSLQGIGAILQVDDVYTKVNKLVTGAPADKSKQIKEGDRIIGVGQGDKQIEDVIGWRLDDVVQLIRGKAGSEVRLEILPKDEVVAGESKVVTLTRETVKLEELSAKSKIIEVTHNNQVHKMGVISIPKFYVDWEAKYAKKLDDYKSTSRDVAKFIREFQKQNIDGLIIDLRNNGGGALDESVELTGLFIDQGPVVQQKDSRGRVREFPDTDAGLLYDGPLVVLVNGGSASASEIFAGAIQDYGRGLIVGEQTFGKGTVQSMLDLNDYRGLNESKLGQLKLTTSKFYRVSGESTQHRGIVPDVAFPSAFNREDFGESSYQNALAWDTIRAARFKPVNEVQPFVAKLNQNHAFRAAKSNEFMYLKQDIEEYNHKKNVKSVSLNAEERKKEIDERKKQKLTRVNQRLADKGLKPVETLKDFDESVFEDDDFKLQESANILVDFIYLKDSKKLAEKK